MAVLEAAALGVPTVASSVGGIPEIVEDGVTGVLVKPGDADALAVALRKLAGSPHLATLLGHAAWGRVRRRHRPDDHLDALLTHTRAPVRRPTALRRRIGSSTSSSRAPVSVFATNAWPRTAGMKSTTATSSKATRSTRAAT
ncbi:MAG: glycosyltransferase [Actinomycetota bacterium]|nr:glycosyltransferase [Actinomycetota bacterium]